MEKRIVKIIEYNKLINKVKEMVQRGFEPIFLEFGSEEYTKISDN